MANNNEHKNFTPFSPTMKLQALELPTAKLSSNQTQKRVLLLAFTLVLLTVIQLHLNDRSGSSSSRRPFKLSFDSLNWRREGKECDIFSGEWVENPAGPYYTNGTCNFMIDEQNCLKFGRTDEKFTKWRWKPDECELPLFDGVEFLEVVRGKALAFVGDSVGRNQMQSLLCLLSTVVSPVDVSKNGSDIKFKKWFFPHYNFTVAILWSPYLVKSKDSDPNGFGANSLMTLNIDEADEAWTSEIEQFDYVIISAGQWFFRPLFLYENGQLIGCHKCQETNLTQFITYYAYRKAFRTAFLTLNRLKNFKGVTFLRTYSPSHYENGDWNKGGSCERKLPLTRAELKLQWYIMQMLQTQMEEFKEAEQRGLAKGLKFRVLNTTVAMMMRPDGHPNRLGLRKNSTVADCVHWCLPGPVDTWNELFLYMLKKERKVDSTNCSRFHIFC